MKTYKDKLLFKLFIYEGQPVRRQLRIKLGLQSPSIKCIILFICYLGFIPSPAVEVGYYVLFQSTTEFPDYKGKVSALTVFLNVSTFYVQTVQLVTKNQSSGDPKQLEQRF